MARTTRLLALIAGVLLSAPAVAAAAPAAELVIQHPSRNTVNASTYTPGAMRLVNTGSVAITGLVIDFEPGAGILPDMVIDPDDGTPAGDEVAKGFSPDSPPSGLTATAQYLAPQTDGYRRMEVTLNGLAPGQTMPFSVDVDPTSTKGSPDNAPAGPVSGAEMAGALVTVSFADGARLSTRLTPVPNTGTTANGLVDARAVVPAPAPRPGLARAAGVSPAVVSNPIQRVVVTGPPGATGVVVAAEARTALAGAPGGGFQVSPLEPNMLALGKPPIPFTIGADGTATVSVTLTRQAPPDGSTTTGLNTVVAYLQSGGAPGPMSAPLLMQPAEPGSGSIAFVDPAGATPGTFARRTSGVTGLPEALPLTVSAWIKAPIYGNHQPIIQHGPQSEGDMRGWTLELRTNRNVGFTLNNSDANRFRQFPLPVAPDRWTFIAVTASATTTVAHVWDAEAGWRTSSLAPISPYVPASPEDLLSVGASKGSPSAEFTGLIDDVRIWSTARTPAELQGDYTTKLSGSETGLAAYYPFDDAAGHAVADLAGTNTLFLNGAGGVFPFTATGGDWSPDTPIADPTRAGAPRLVGTFPVEGVDNVPAGARLLVAFSEPMNASTVSAAVTLSGGGQAVPVTVMAGAGNRVFTVVPASPLAVGVPHTLAVAASAADLGGATLAAPATHTFGVIGDPALPADLPGSGTPPPPPPPPVEPPVTPPVVVPPVVVAPPAPTPPAVAPPAVAAPPAAPAAVIPTRAKPAFCVRFPAQRAKLAKQLKLAKRARARATTTRVRVVMTKRMKVATARQRALIVKRNRIC